MPTHEWHRVRRRRLLRWRRTRCSTAHRHTLRRRTVRPRPRLHTHVLSTPQRARLAEREIALGGKAGGEVLAIYFSVYQLRGRMHVPIKPISVLLLAVFDLIFRRSIGIPCDAMPTLGRIASLHTYTSRQPVELIYMDAAFLFPFIRQSRLPAVPSPDAQVPDILSKVELGNLHSHFPKILLPYPIVAGPERMVSGP